jgi:hypothetical protein
MSLNLQEAAAAVEKYADELPRKPLKGSYWQQLL